MQNYARIIIDNFISFIKGLSQMKPIDITATNKHEKYQELLAQITALISHEDNLIANLANISAVLKSTFNWLWVGFYLVSNNELVLGPFQGPMACTRIKKGRGVCGTSWEKNQAIIVSNVHEFPDHIACSTLSNSEIVIPCYNKNGDFIGVLDIDSEELNYFDQIDLEYLQQLVKIIFVKVSL
jgi:L-methionine (R)-S-oxide reductase